MKRLLIVANRLPMRFESSDDRLVVHTSEGGLATGLSSLSAEHRKEWIGWPGIFSNDSLDESMICEKLDDTMHPVFLSEKEVNNYYEGFSNETIWPLFHYFSECTRYSNENWESYKAVNQKFCDKVVEVAREGDIIWVQDYHLMLLPMMLRNKLGNKNPIGFFLHIPFPSFELFRTLPWRSELLSGLSGADLIGFHTREYLQHFMNTMARIGGQVPNGKTLNIQGRTVAMEAFPMGINFEKFNEASRNPEVCDRLASFSKRFAGSKVVLSVDRLDYTKGIINRLRAFDNLLCQYPELKNRVNLVMLAVPSRDNVEKYKDLKIQVDEMVGQINGKHASLSWTPVNYFYRSIPFEHLVALYNLADICLVTPLRDGMNLVAKEYVASKTHGNGVLVLSEMAGAALELKDALLVNPNDEDDVARALKRAIHMHPSEQKLRMDKMRKRVSTHTVNKWGSDFINQLQKHSQKIEKATCTLVAEGEINSIRNAFIRASKRLIVLDYDGTLMPFFNSPTRAVPDRGLKELLLDLKKSATVGIVSGRDKKTLENWFGDYGIELIAEHGNAYKKDGKWQNTRRPKTSWKKNIHPVLLEFAASMPKSFIEEKMFSLVFHYRCAGDDLSGQIIPKLKKQLEPVCHQLNLDLMQADCAIEIRQKGVHKGQAVKKWLSDERWDFVMVMGDDVTDEDMFRALPDEAYTIKVGKGMTCAGMRVESVAETRRLLHILARAQMTTPNPFFGAYKNAI